MKKNKKKYFVGTSFVDFTYQLQNFCQMVITKYKVLTQYRERAGNQNEEAFFSTL